jgi:hypothetical protein
MNTEQRYYVKTSSDQEHMELYKKLNALGKWGDGCREYYDPSESYVYINKNGVAQYHATKQHFLTDDKVFLSVKEYFKFIGLKKTPSQKKKTNTVVDINSKIKSLQEEIDKLNKEREVALLKDAADKGWKVGAHVEIPAGMYVIEEVYIVNGGVGHSPIIRETLALNSGPIVCCKSGAHTFPITWDKAKLITDIVIHGYKMNKYEVGDEVVTFGCAQINVELLTSIYNHNKKTSGRKVSEIKLCSGKVLTADNINQIVEHINKINK